MTIWTIVDESKVVWECECVSSAFSDSTPGVSGWVLNEPPETISVSELILRLSLYLQVSPTSGPALPRNQTNVTIVEWGALQYAEALM